MTSRFSLVSVSLQKLKLFKPFYLKPLTELVITVECATPLNIKVDCSLKNRIAKACERFVFVNYFGCMY